MAPNDLAPNVFNGYLFMARSVEDRNWLLQPQLMIEFCRSPANVHNGEFKQCSSKPFVTAVTPRIFGDGPCKNEDCSISSSSRSRSSRRWKENCCCVRFEKISRWQI